MPAKLQFIWYGTHGTGWNGWICKLYCLHLPMRVIFSHRRLCSAGSLPSCAWTLLVCRLFCLPCISKCGTRCVCVCHLQITVLCASNGMLFALISFGPWQIIAAWWRDAIDMLINALRACVRVCARAHLFHDSPCLWHCVRTKFANADSLHTFRFGTMSLPIRNAQIFIFRLLTLSINDLTSFASCAGHKIYDAAKGRVNGKKNCYANRIKRIFLCTPPCVLGYLRRMQTATVKISGHWLHDCRRHHWHTWRKERK